MVEKNIFFAKVQFEIRYTPILNFEQVYRGILSPYLALVSAFKIINERTSSEGLLLYFENEQFQIDVRWDRIVVLFEGNLEKLFEKNSQIKYFFDIYEQLYNLNSFGKVSNYIALSYYVKIEDKIYSKIIDAFKERYLSKDSSFNVLKAETSNDVAMILNFEKEGNDINWTFGPFEFERDKDKHKLFPFQTAIMEEYVGKVGMMSEVKMVKNIKTIDLSIMKNVFDESYKLHKSI